MVCVQTVWRSLTVNMGKLFDILKLDLGDDTIERASNYIFSKLKNYRVSIDAARNIYVTKGVATYPAFVASISDNYCDDGVEIERIVKNVWVGYNKEGITPVKFSAGSKAAMYLAICLIEKLDNVKCVFKFNTGGFDKSFFDDCSWVLELNGKGNTDILTMSSGMVQQCSSSFRIMLKTVGKKFGFNVEGSSMPPLTAFNLPISAACIPNGHYEPYGGFSQVVEADVNKALSFALDMATKVKAVCKMDKDLYCKSCNQRLTSAEEHYCYLCLNTLRKEGNVPCGQCGGNLYTAKEFFTRACRVCGNTVGSQQ